MFTITNLKKINFSHIPYIIIIILLIVVTCQSGQRRIETKEVVKVDTVYKYITIRDTIPGKTIYIKGDVDTVWLDRPGFVPRPTYQGLLEQYKTLGGNYFKKNVFETRFNIENYGYVTVKDSISENWLNSSELTSFLTIPEKTVTVTEKEDPKRQLYIGLILTGDKVDIMNSANVGLLLKDKKDRLFGGQIGITPRGAQIGISSYMKIRLKRN